MLKLEDKQAIERIQILLREVLRNNNQKIMESVARLASVADEQAKYAFSPKFAVEKIDVEFTVTKQLRDRSEKALELTNNLYHFFQDELKR